GGVDYPTGVIDLACERSNTAMAYANVAARHISRRDHSAAPNCQIELRHLASPSREISVCAAKQAQSSRSLACTYSSTHYNADNTADGIVSNLSSVTIIAAVPRVSTLDGAAGPFRTNDKARDVSEKSTEQPRRAVSFGRTRPVAR